MDIHSPSEPDAEAPDEIAQACEQARQEGPRTDADYAARAFAGQAAEAFAFSEVSLAAKFTDRHRDKIRYCHGASAWFLWDGTAWRRDATGQALGIALAYSASVARIAPPAAVTRLGSVANASAVLRGASSMPGIAVSADAWDSDPWLLGTPGGVVDLRTGIIRPAQPADGITCTAAVAPASTADCPRWLRFLDEATGGDAELIRFLRQWAGYSLTGDTSEQALLFIFGGGRNGKSVFLKAISQALGDYAKIAPADTFEAAQGDRHPADLAMLAGARMVVASETEDGRKWAESRIKSITGGEPITARFMRGNFFTFTPQFKITIIGNHRPELANVDDAMRRRVNMVNFDRKPAAPDPTLDDKLKAEWPGILRWMIDGCLDWQQHGLRRPGVVVEATAAYFDDQDFFRQWIEERCDTGPAQSDTTADLFRSWSAFATAGGEKPGSSKRFAQLLVRAGFTPTKHVPGQNGKRGFLGIAARREAARSWQDRDDTDDLPI